jgi:hypothetical protein
MRWGDDSRGAQGHTALPAGRVPVAKTPGLAPKTVNVNRMIHLALASAMAWRYLEYNPAKHAALSREAGRATAGHLWRCYRTSKFPDRLDHGK